MEYPNSPPASLFSITLPAFSPPLFLPTPKHPPKPQARFLPRAASRCFPRVPGTGLGALHALSDDGVQNEALLPAGPGDLVHLAIGSKRGGEPGEPGESVGAQCSGFFLEDLRGYFWWKKEWSLWFGWKKPVMLHKACDLTLQRQTVIEVV